MQIYVGITDKDWFELLKSEKCDEVNFWKPGTSNFKAIKQNDMFLFKLHAPDNYIVGGGFFVSFSILPTHLAWEAFGIKNGTRNLKELNDRIIKYRARNKISGENPQIGCIILTEPFFFEREEWIPAPEDWSSSIVQGKRYDTETFIGKKLYDDVLDRIGDKTVNAIDTSDELPKYSESMTKHRLGQGAFRVSVTDAYHRRCAITGEKTLPVLQAAHIKPVSEKGPYKVSNGILLKSDFHTLYDEGYITITTDYRIDVSKRLHEDYGNGKDYYKYHGQSIFLPDSMEKFPAKEYLEWHNENIFVG